MNVAGVAMPYGSILQLGEDGRYYPLLLLFDWRHEPVSGDVGKMSGVLLRPPSARHNSCSAGDAIEIRLNGEILALDADGSNIFLNLRDGKPAR